MNAPLRLLDLGVIPYLQTQSLYHAIADAMRDDSPDTLILCVPDRPYFCIGFHQDARQELDLEFLRTNNFPVLRRRVGGGTTYLDSNQLFYQLVLHHRRAPAMVNALYQYALTPPVETLRALGLNANLCGANEMTVSDKRIAGIGAGRIGEASVVVGNFLFDFDYAAMARAWRVPTETYRQLARAGLEKHVTTLTREMASVPSMEKVKTHLVEKYRAGLQRMLELGTLTDEEARRARENEPKLGADEWLFELENPRRGGLKIAGGVYMFSETVYLLLGDADGKLNVTLRARGNAIDGLAIETESGFGGMAWQSVAQFLQGAALDKSALEERLARMSRAGLVPDELNLKPLVNALVRMGKR